MQSPPNFPTQTYSQNVTSSAPSNSKYGVQMHMKKTDNMQMYPVSNGEVPTMSVPPPHLAQYMANAKMQTMYTSQQHIYTNNG